MAVSRTDIQKRRLEQINKMADSLVADILNQIDEKGSAIDAKDLTALNTIISQIESMQFNGDVELLKNTVQVYQKAINAIDEQLKSEEMKEFEKFSKDSLEEAKKYIQEQSKNGRVGYIFDQVEKLTEQEISGSMEKDYNDEKIKDLDYEMKGIKEEEEKRKEPFRKIKVATKDNMQNVKKYHEIREKLLKLKNEKNKLQKELDDLKKVKDGDKEENAKKIDDLSKRIKDIDKEIIKVAQEAKTKDDDKTFDLKKDEEMDVYYTRVEKNIDDMEDASAKKVVDDIKKIGDEEIEIEDGKKVKISEYLKDYIDGTKEMHGLDQKLAIDFNMVKDQINETEKHKKLDKLEEEKQKYEKRNNDIQADMDVYKEISKEDNKGSGSGTGMGQYKEPSPWTKFWKRLTKKGRDELELMEKEKKKIEEQNRIYAEKQAKKEMIDERRKTLGKSVLEEVEKEDKKVRGNAFIQKLKVNQTQAITATVKTNMNTNRENLYKKMAEEAKKREDEGR